MSHAVSRPRRLPPMAPWVMGAMLALALPGAAAFAQQQAQLAIPDYGQTRQVQLEVNKSMLLDLPADVSEVVISNPTIAGAIMRTSRRAILQGVTGGDTNVLFLDANGRPIAVIDLEISEPESGMGRSLEAALARAIPGSNIRVQAITGSNTDATTHFLLTGSVLTAEDKTIAEQLAAAISGSESPAGGSLIQVIGPQQVMLQVVVAEVSRDTVKELGINLSGSLTVGSFSGGFNSTQTSLANGANGTWNVGNVSLTAELRALEQRGALRTLAEPVLSAMSGQPAEFLAGGQIPVLSGIDDTGRTFELKDFGVQLKFTPTIRSNGIIALDVETEVSEISETGFDIGGEVIPGFNNRRAKTSIELPAGQTLAIAGMIQDKLRQQISGLPGLSNIPILGALFRSREFQRQQTELVIIVTPYFATPTPSRPPLPTDHVEAASDAEAIFLGRMERNYGVGASPGMRGSFSGSVGFVLD